MSDRLHLKYCDLTGQSTLVESPSGEFVLYDDYLSEVQAKQATIDKLVDDFYLVYSGINILMGVLGAHGEISTRDSVSTDMMNILYNIDDGRFIQDKEQFLKALINSVTEGKNET